MKLLTLLLTGLLTLPVFAAPKVVVSIKPIHNIALAIMEGVGTPTLLVPPGASPHNYALAPSQAKALQEAHVIVWVGPELETFLSQSLQRRQPKATVLTLLKLPGMTIYPASGVDEHHNDTLDPHLWLDPLNLITYASALTDTLVKLDPDNAKRYQANASHTIAQLKTLDAKIMKELTPIQSTPIMVFHNAYQYFEKRYQLDIVGTVVLRADTSPSVARILSVQEQIKTHNVQCIFTEPQFKPAIVDRLRAETDINIGVLNPLGPASPSGLPGTQALFNDLAGSIVACVQGEL